MTLEEMKADVLRIIEEYSEDADLFTDDDDIGNKLNTAINLIMNEIARFKKINAKKTMEVTKDQEIEFNDIDKSMYQLNIIRGVDYDRIENTIIFNEAGTAKIYYYKYPTQITSETEDTYVFELDTDALEVAKIGIAGLILSSDVSNNYGAIYTNMYREKLQTLDPRTSMSSVYIDGSIEV